LGGLPLGDSHVHDSLDQHRQLEDEPELRSKWIAGGNSRHRQHPGCGAQVVACRSGAGQAPVGQPCGAIVGSGSSP
jgi:hypothetical protein